MSDFNPGPGWREVTDPLARLERPRIVHQGDDGSERYWVRKEPVPLLPTVPHTTIDITAANGASVLDDPVFTLRKMTAGLRWWNERGPHTAEWLQERITGFEVLSEPRAATAKTVLDRVREEQIDRKTGWLASLFDEFKVKP